MLIEYVSFLPCCVDHSRRKEVQVGGMEPARGMGVVWMNWGKYCHTFLYLRCTHWTSYYINLALLYATFMISFQSLNSECIINIYTKVPSIKSVLLLLPSPLQAHKITSNYATARHSYSQWRREFAPLPLLRKSHRRLHMQRQRQRQQWQHCVVETEESVRATPEMEERRPQKPPCGNGWDVAAVPGIPNPATRTTQQLRTFVPPSLRPACAGCSNFAIQINWNCAHNAHAQDMPCQSLASPMDRPDFGSQPDPVANAGTPFVQHNEIKK